MRCESCKIPFDGKNASCTLLSILIAPRVALDFSISRDFFSPDMEKEMRSVVAAKFTPHCSCRNELKMMLIPDKYRHPSTAVHRRQYSVTPAPFAASNHKGVSLSMNHLQGFERETRLP